MSAIDPIERGSFRWRLVATGALPLLLAAACSLPVDERVTPYDVSDLPPALVEPTTTTSTTTTTTVPTDGSTPASGDVTTTTTIAPADTAPVSVYYTLGASDQMQALTRSLVPPVPLSLVISQLESPSGVAEFGLRTSVRPGLIEEPIVVERATATVTLDQAVLDRLSITEERRAIAQIVLTLTSFSTSDQGNIGLVLFETDGDGYEVFVPALGGNSEPDVPLTYDDFSRLVVSASLTPSTPSTSVPAATSSTVPEPVTSDAAG